MAMESFWRVMRRPGAHNSIECAAPTQMVTHDLDQEEKHGGIDVSLQNINTYSTAAKPRLLDRWLDGVVHFSGSQFTFFTILGGLLAWAFMGICFGQTTDWQIAISDVQAILNMVFDSFLMRQQQNAYRELLIVLSCLRSRAASNKKMLGKLVEIGVYQNATETQLCELPQTILTSELPPENLLGRICTTVSSFMGHIGTIAAFWVCIFVWIGFGHYCGWSVRWQLYINSATSALMLFLLAFLANIRERHGKHEARCLDSIYKIDAALELELRAATKCLFPNEPVLVLAPQVGKVQRAINYYADLVGTLIGIVILIAVTIIWVLVGPAMKFNSNWWLMIGTYAGLVGMNDGFVLRNVFNKQQEHEDVQFTQLMRDDLEMLAIIGMEHLSGEQVAKFSLTSRISIAVGRFCSHENTVVVGAISILTLVVGASTMAWSVTGQLLCNIPPSIVESFFTMILITGHNIGETKRRVDLHNIYLWRLKLASIVNNLAKIEPANVGSPEPGGAPTITEQIDAVNSGGQKLISRLDQHDPA